MHTQNRILVSSLEEVLHVFCVDVKHTVTLQSEVLFHHFKSSSFKWHFISYTEVTKQSLQR